MSLLDRSFLSDGRPWLNRNQAVEYVGYDSDDPRQVNRFRAWASKRGIRMQPGREVYARADLDAAVRRAPVSEEVAEIQARARESVRRFNERRAAR